jgi:aryl sulfotransferase
MSDSLVWLASYPKSGNTWLRAMLTALLDPQHHMPGLNAMVGGSELGERQFLDDVCGVDSSNLTYEGLKPWLRAMRLCAAEQVEPPYFVKTHDAYASTAEGLSLFPSEASKLAIHIVRDPRDVAVSLAAHDSSSIDAAIAKMADPHYMLNGAHHEGGEFLPVKVGDWSGHSLSWLEQTEIAVLLLRYEDMIADPAAALRSVGEACGLIADADAYAAAAAATAFDKLRATEDETGFGEKPAGMANFFREGRAGGWRNLLSSQQLEAITTSHGAMMQRLGYL